MRESRSLRSVLQSTASCEILVVRHYDGCRLGHPFQVNALPYFVYEAEGSAVT